MDGCIFKISFKNKINQVYNNKFYMLHTVSQHVRRSGENFLLNKFIKFYTHI